MDVYIIMTPTIVMYSIYYYTVVRKTGLASLDNLFIASQVIMQLGTIPLLDKTNEADILYSQILMYTTPLFILSSMVGELLFNRWRTLKLIHVKLYKPSNKFIIILIISILITFIYYQSVGYSVFFVGVSSIFSGDEADIATLRLASYAGSRYLFPGYVNQFKNTLLPGMSIILLIYIFKNRWQFRYLIGTLLTLTSLVGLLGTGQRGAFVLSMLTLIAFTYFYSRRLLFKYIPIILITAIPIFFASSLVLDRNDTRNTLATDPIVAVQDLSTELSNRIFRDNQYSGLIGYRFVAFKENQHGSEWLQSIVGLLPGEGFRGSDLAGQIFKEIYGSDRGTSPISLWGSIYYNFGMAATIIAPLILGLMYKWIYSLFSRRKYINHGQVYAMAGIFITLGTWIADGPITILNTGFISYILIFFICKQKNDV